MVASPAAAQYYPAPNQGYANPHPSANSGTYGNGNISVRIGQLQARLQEGVQNRSITRREARPIRQQIAELASLERRYSANGLTGQELADLQQRMRIVRQALRRADDGAQGRYAQWDREDADWGNQNNNGWNSQHAGRIDANRDGWDDRDHNRNGRWEDDVNYGQPGYQQQYGYQQQPAAPTGIAGLISSVLGGNGVQIGQRAPANLYAVPYQYQGQYRDGNGVYYRSDGRQIYQIETRNHTVVRTFPL